MTLLYGALTIVMTLPFSLSPGSHVVADLPDTHLFIWTLAWDSHAFLRQPLTIFDANIYYPFTNTLAYSENLIGTALFAAPVIWLTGNLVLAMNLAALITCALCGTGAYVLARRVGLTVAAAFISGLIFAFGPPRFIRLGQLHLTALQWMPFCLAFLHSYFASGRRRDLLLAVGFFSLQALASGHGTAYLAIAIALFILWQFATGTPLALAKRFQDFGVAGVALIAPTVWIFIPYQLAQQEAGLRRGYLSDAQPGLESWLASPTRVHHFLQAQIPGFPDKEPDAYLFPGIVVLVLGGIALTRLGGLARLRGNAAAFYALLGTLSTLMFVAWPIELWRYVYWLPGFNFIRMPSRFILLTMLALAVLAGFGVERISRGLRPGARTLTTILLAMLIMVESWVYPFPSVPYQVVIPAIDRWLDTQPKPFVVAEVPVPTRGDLGALERQQTQAMLHATAHWQKTIHGYSGIRRAFHEDLYDALSNFPDQNSLDGLRAAGVTHVVVHSGDYGSRWWSVEENIKHAPGLKLAHTEGSDRVYLLLPAR